MASVMKSTFHWRLSLLSKARVREDIHIWSDTRRCPSALRLLDIIGTQLVSVADFGVGSGSQYRAHDIVIPPAPRVGASHFIERRGLFDCRKGIGVKTAQRILVDLKSKVTGLAEQENIAVAPVMQTSNAALAEEAVAALVMLGFQKAASQKAVSSILKKEPTARVEQVIKYALKMLWWEEGLNTYY